MSRGHSFLWRYKNWSDIVNHHLSKLQPKPKFVVVNAGLWPHDFTNATVLTSVRHALDQHGMIGIYKTTTKPFADMSTMTDPYEVEACRILHYCLNLSWTGELNNREDFVDDKHFKASINRRFNEQLLDLVQQIRRRKRK
jgi:hypothetical protein